MAATVEDRSRDVGMEDSEASGSEKSAPKHMLQNKWTLWFDQPKPKKSGSALSQQEWNASLEKVYTFDSVEDFWCLFNNLLPVSNLENGSSYNLFKEGISPQWEDRHNEGGGRWYFTLKGRQNPADQLWLYMVLGLIGEQIDCQDRICGVVISPRRDEFRISLWTRDANNKKIQQTIGRHMAQVLKLPGDLVSKTVFRTHADDKRGQRRHGIYRLSDCLRG